MTFGSSCFEKRVTESKCFDIFSWDLDKNDLWVGVTHVTSTEVGLNVILGSLTFWLSFFFFLIVTMSTYFDVFMGVGHNDPWVDSHMGHQHMWGQRSSKGH